MKLYDKIFVSVYAVAMTVLFIIGSCEYDMPIYLLGAVLVFVVAAYLIRERHPYLPEESEDK